MVFTRLFSRCVLGAAVTLLFAGCTPTGCWLAPGDELCDDGLFCNGQETCNRETGRGEGAPPPCHAAELMCDEANDRCVECLSDEDCREEGTACDNSVCSAV